MNQSWIIHLHSFLQQKKLGYLSFVFISKLDLHTRLNIVHGFYFLQKYLQKKKSEDTWPLKSLFWRRFCYFHGFYFLLKYLQKKEEWRLCTWRLKSLLGRRFCYYLIGSRKSLGKLLAQCKPTFYHYHKTQICNLHSSWLWPLSWDCTTIIKFNT